MTSTFYIRNISGETINRQIFPENEHNFVIEKSKEEDHQFYRDKFNGDLVLSGNDYEFFKDIEQYDNREKWGFYWYKNEIEIYKGYFIYTDIEFNDTRKICKLLNTNPFDDYSDIFENWEEEINILNADKSFILDNYKAKLEFEIRIQKYFIPKHKWLLYRSVTIVGEETWTIHIYAREIVKTPSVVDLTDDGFEVIEYYDNYIKYARHFTVNYTAPLDEEIVVIAIDEDKNIKAHYAYDDSVIVYDSDLNAINDWYRLENKGYVLRHIRVPGSAFKYNVLVYIKNTIYDGSTINVYEIDHTNAINFKTSINYILNKIGFDGECKSTFLFNDAYTDDAPQSIKNYYDTHPTYNYYSEEKNKLNGLYLIEKTDFKNPFANQAATIGLLKLKDLIEDLKILFPIDWEIDEDGNFRIEHIIWFNKDYSLDLTNSNYNIPNSYKYSNEKILNRESFKPYEAGNNDFLESEIEYINVPLISNDENKIEKQLSILIVDIKYIKDNLNKISNNGFVLVQCEDNGVGDMTIQSEIGIKSGLNYQNNHLSFGNLLPKYWLDNRCRTRGYVNGVLTIFNSIIPLKEQEEITIKSNENIDPQKRIKTEMGEGIVEKMQYKPSINEYKINLIYE